VHKTFLVTGNDGFICATVFVTL